MCPCKNGNQEVVTECWKTLDTREYFFCKVNPSKPHDSKTGEAFSRSKLSRVKRDCLMLLLGFFLFHPSTYPSTYPSTSADPSHSLSISQHSISKPDPSVNSVTPPTQTCCTNRSFFWWYSNYAALWPTVCIAKHNGMWVCRGHHRNKYDPTPLT